MHEVGAKTLAALRERFPEFELVGHETNYNNVLTITFWQDGKRWTVRSPSEDDYRQRPYMWWLHRFGTEIKRKLG